MTRRVTAVVLALAAAVAAAGCASDQLPTANEPQPAPVVIRGHDPALVTERGPVPPESGAWLGAWVKPQSYGPTGRAEAFGDFEDRTRASLQIVHDFQEWGDEFPSPQQAAMLKEAELLMISWAGTDSRSIITGSYDALIRQRAEAIKALGVPILLRFRWEMDRPNLRTIVRSPEDYVAAWKHARSIFTEVGATNAAWTWCPHVLGFVEGERNAAAYYPGDDQVDWLCADVYSESYSNRGFVSFGSQMDAFLQFAQGHPKPIVVGEYGVRGTSSAGDRARWLRDVGMYTRAHPQIKALVYFSSKQDGKPLQNTTLTEEPEILDAFQELVDDPYFRVPVVQRKRTN